MKKLTKITFEFEDGTIAFIDDVRAALTFQSRCNSSGIFSGIEDFLIELGEEAKDVESTS
jgi:hypothetical protein